MTKSIRSFACLAETHDLCARRWKKGEQDCVCSCPCHQQEQEPASTPPDVMQFVHAFRRIFLDRLPRPLAADWDPVYGPRLAGFPTNVCYTDLRGEYAPDRATYYFDPRTYSENLEVRRMQYYAKREARFWVEVVICKKDGSMEIGKYRDETLVSAAIGPDFRAAVIRATVSGLEKDEPVDESS